EPLPAVPAQQTPAAAHPSIEPAPIAPQLEPAPIVTAEVAELAAEPSPAVAEPTGQAGAAKALTAGQKAFLASLNPEQRAGVRARRSGHARGPAEPSREGFGRDQPPIPGTLPGAAGRGAASPAADPCDARGADRAIARLAAGLAATGGAGDGGHLRHAKG